MKIIISDRDARLTSTVVSVGKSCVISEAHQASPCPKNFMICKPTVKWSEFRSIFHEHLVYTMEDVVVVLIVIPLLFAVDYSFRIGGATMLK